MLGRLRQDRRIDLHDRPEEARTASPAARAARPRTSSRSMRSSITPKKPSRGCGIARLVGGSGCGCARPREVGRVHAAREGVDAAGAGRRFASYRLWPPVKTRSAPRISSRSRCRERRRRAGERGEFVHAVVDDRPRPQVPRERAAPSACSTRARSRADRCSAMSTSRSCRCASITAASSRPRGDGTATRCAAALARGDLAAERPLADDRLLDEEHAPVTGRAREELLWPLEHEVPAQVRQADEVGGTLEGALHEGQRRRMSTRQGSGGRTHTVGPGLARACHRTSIRVSRRSCVW